MQPTTPVGCFPPARAPVLSSQAPVQQTQATAAHCSFPPTTLYLQANPRIYNRQQGMGSGGALNSGGKQGVGQCRAHGTRACRGACCLHRTDARGTSMGTACASELPLLWICKWQVGYERREQSVGG